MYRKMALVILLSALMIMSMAGQAIAQPDYDKMSLWVNGTQLRGVNIWQRQVMLEWDGADFMGSGFVGPPYFQEDFDQLAALGANYVNISHPGPFSLEPPYEFVPEIETNLDHLLTMIGKADMFAVISFRNGPGLNDLIHYEDVPEDQVIQWLWEEQEAQDAWVEMWRGVAEHYRHNPVVAGYHLLVEPFGHASFLDIWEPDEFYPDYAGTLYDWNPLAGRIVQAIREVDPETPILVGGMGWSALEWLPYVQRFDDPRIVYNFHHYVPVDYTHGESGDGIAYPGQLDLDWDGEPDDFDREWLADYLGEYAGAFIDSYQLPVTVGEFGINRWVPGGAEFIDDEIALFEDYGFNWAIWEFNTSWPDQQEYNDDMDIRHGPDPDNHTNVDNPLLDVLRRYWRLNAVRPSNVGG